MDIGTLSIGSAVIHEINKRQSGAATSGLRLSEAEARLAPGESIFIAERLKKAMRSHAVPVIDRQEPGSGASLVVDYFESRCSLVDMSRALAELLAKTQFAISPAGLLLVAAVSDHSGGQGLAVAKLEHDTGIQAIAETDEQGRPTYTVTVLEDLLLADTGKVFKAAIFPKPDPGQLLRANVVDRQTAGRDIANFFLSNFLGCDLVAKPDVLTERFFEATQSYVERLPDPQVASRIQVALLAEMHSNSTRVSPTEFVRHHVPPQEQDAFRGWLVERSVQLTPFEKDSSRISSKIARVRFQSGSGVTVLAPPETIHSDDNPTGSVRVVTGDQNEIRIVDKDIRVASGSARA